MEGAVDFLVDDVVVLAFDLGAGFFTVDVGFLAVAEVTLGLAVSAFLLGVVGFLAVADLGFAEVMEVVLDLVVEEAGFGLIAVLEVGLF